ncbi:MAG: hypothetical protein ABIO40_01120 [Devosia sp.]
MRHRSAALALVALLATPALAQTGSSVDIFARGVAGLAENGSVIMGNLGKGTVRKVTVGAYEVQFAGSIATITFDEPVPCLFTQETVIQGQPSTLVRFDFTRVESLQLGDQGPYEDLNAIALQLNGPEDIVQIFDAGGALKSVPAIASIVTSLTAADIEAAVVELRKACPAP